MKEVSITAHQWRHGVGVITTVQLHSTKPELRFCEGENLWQWSLLEIRLNDFRCSTISTGTIHNHQHHHNHHWVALFCKMSWNSQENTCAWGLFKEKCKNAGYWKKDSIKPALLWISQNFQNRFSTSHLQATAFVEAFNICIVTPKISHKYVKYLKPNPSPKFYLCAGTVDIFIMWWPSSKTVCLVILWHALSSLTRFSPMSHFYTPRKRQKAIGFLTF